MDICTLLARMFRFRVRPIKTQSATMNILVKMIFGRVQGLPDPVDLMRPRLLAEWSLLMTTCSRDEARRKLP